MCLDCVIYASEQEKYRMGNKGNKAELNHAIFVIMLGDHKDA